jgi:hypothetical protein
VRYRGTRRLPGNLVELVDRGPNLGKGAYALVGRASLRIDRGNGPAAPSRQLTRDEPGEVCAA